MDNTQDPLTHLISEDFRKEDRERLALTLKPYIVFDKNDKTLNFTDTFFKIGNNANRIELALLAEKARSLLFENGENEGMGQKELILLKIMPAGSVKSSLNKLSIDKKVIKGERGYYIPNYKLSEALVKYLIEENATKK